MPLASSTPDPAEFIPSTNVDSHSDMVSISGDTYTVGSDLHYREERCARRMAVDGFLIDPLPVANQQFAEFVTSTGYVKLAERPLYPALYPGAPSENPEPGSMGFVPTPRPVDLRQLAQWQRWVQGASWRHPLGPGSSMVRREDHPVVQVAWEDAEAFAKWSGKVLLTQAEWEYTARSGLDGAEFTWGDDDTRHRAPWRTPGRDSSHGGPPN